MDRRIAKQNLIRSQRAATALEEAVRELESLFPLDLDTFDPDAMEARDTLLLDGFRARYSSLQDLIGTTLFKTVVRLDEDETPERPLTTRERVALMEKRGILEQEQWRELREIRNQFAHEYPDQHQEKALNLNTAWEAVQPLLAIARKIAVYLEEKHRLTTG